MPGSTPSGGLVNEMVPTWELAGHGFSSPSGPKAASSHVPSDGAPDGLRARPVGKFSSEERTCEGARSPRSSGTSTTTPRPVPMSRWGSSGVTVRLAGSDASSQSVDCIEPEPLLKLDDA